MKRTVKQIAAALLLALALVNTAHATSSFLDVSGNASYAEAVEYLNDIGVMQGDGNGNFNPDKSVSRAEMAAIICRMLGETENLAASNTFTDVPVSHWANGYVTKAASLGIVNGYGNGKFGPSDSVTYEQAVTIVIRTLGGEHLAQKSGDYPDGFLRVAEDHGFLENIIAEKGQPLTRGNIAVILFNCANFSFTADFDNAQVD